MCEIKEMSHRATEERKVVGRDTGILGERGCGITIIRSSSPFSIVYSVYASLSNDRDITVFLREPLGEVFAPVSLVDHDPGALAFFDIYVDEQERNSNKYTVSRG